MLHFEGRQGGKENPVVLKFSEALLLFLLLLTGCQERTAYTDRNLTLDAFADLKDEQYALDSSLIRKNLEHIFRNDHDDCFALKQARRYYREGGSLVWVRCSGLDSRADTLLAVLRKQLPEMGFNENVFISKQIEDDMNRLRSLSFDDSNPLNLVAARLDYHLTSAYLRYVAGQRFGFVNPFFVLNRYDARDRDTSGTVISYRHLFDIDMDHPDEFYVKRALHRVTSDSLGLYLRQVEPTGKFYHRLQQMLSSTSTSSERRKLLVNMERCRWRDKLETGKEKKYVIVNIPAFHLWAVDPDTMIDMRVACGAIKTKTPLLSSRITHMEVNPEWVIPMSIVSDEVARHGGDSSYFARHGYYIADKKTGQRMSPKSVTPSMLASGKYRVAQHGGSGNSLGRIIFRFPNNFSVFLHDTSSPGAFQRDNRGVSHGCVRVQRPFDLAAFMLGRDADEWLLDKLRISMGMKPETDQGREYLEELDPSKPVPNLVRYLKVTSRVPIFITYYTIFQTPDGLLSYYPDVYGYDEAIGEVLKTYIQ